MFVASLCKLMHFYVFSTALPTFLLPNKAAEKVLMDAARLGRETRGGLDRFTASWPHFRLDRS